MLVAWRIPRTPAYRAPLQLGLSDDIAAARRLRTRHRGRRCGALEAAPSLLPGASALRGLEHRERLHCAADRHAHRERAEPRLVHAQRVVSGHLAPAAAVARRGGS